MCNRMRCGPWAPTRRLRNGRAYDAAHETGTVTSPASGSAQSGVRTIRYFKTECDIFFRAHGAGARRRPAGRRVPPWVATPMHTHEG